VQGLVIAYGIEQVVGGMTMVGFHQVVGTSGKQMWCEENNGIRL
jgi:hypothetical protein